MAIIDITQTFDYLSPKQTIVGLDLGSKTIGIAVSDIGLHFAHPRLVLARTKFSNDARSLIKILKEENVGAIVIGLPLHMDGSQSPRAQSTRTFVRNMAAHTTLPFILWDERLSTVAAERNLISMDVSRSKRNQRIDAAAAAFILQGALDRLHILRRD
ncbi:Holliday junction resolvase RuvX [Bartonella sp. DGB2]|uniref:Holliday junction resolvase RuvX n=1 Tax=Bartonella sp. DGB2 TaxID=3388426 RepID=UPI00399016D0